jgi:hypothetical protein
VHEVVQDARVEEAENLRVAVVAGELETIVEVRRQAWMKPMMPTNTNTTLKSVASICTVDRSRQPARAVVGCVAILPPGWKGK